MERNSPKRDSSAMEEDEEAVQAQAQASSINDTNKETSNVTTTTTTATEKKKMTRLRKKQKKKAYNHQEAILQCVHDALRTGSMTVQQFLGVPMVPLKNGVHPIRTIRVTTTSKPHEACAFRLHPDHKKRFLFHPTKPILVKIQPLLVLDLNGILCHRIRPHKEPPGIKFRASTHHVAGTPVIPRPDLDSFLQYLNQHFCLAVWTSAKPKTAKALVQALFPPDVAQQLLFVWGQSKCKAVMVSSSRNDDEDEMAVEKEEKETTDEMMAVEKEEETTAATTTPKKHAQTETKEGGSGIFDDADEEEEAVVGLSSTDTKQQQPTIQMKDDGDGENRRSEILGKAAKVVAAAAAAAGDVYDDVQEEEEEEEDGVVDTPMYHNRAAASLPPRAAAFFYEQPDDDYDDNDDDNDAAEGNATTAAATTTSTATTVFEKDLSRVWNEFPLWNPNNTLLMDDSPNKCTAFRQNALHPPPMHGQQQPSQEEKECAPNSTTDSHNNNTSNSNDDWLSDEENARLQMDFFQRLVEYWQTHQSETSWDEFGQVHYAECDSSNIPNAKQPPPSSSDSENNATPSLQIFLQENATGLMGWSV